jgi:prolyl-tRNA synthetase
MELIGIPHRVVVGYLHLDDGKVEYKGRLDADMQLIPIDEIVPFLERKLSA